MTIVPLETVPFRLLAALLLAAAVASAACTPPPAAGPSVIFLSLDTLRRDQVGVYMRPGAGVTPNLDRFAARSVVFDRAYATIPFTLPSHLSMFTGLYPDVHKVMKKKVRLNDHLPTLPEMLEARGYRTIGLVSIEWMDGKFGFARGFEHYERLDYGLTYSERINRRLFELLDEDEAEKGAKGARRPVFLFLHYIDPHSDFFNVGHSRLPYYARADYLAKVGIDPDTREFCTPADECATDFLMAANRDRFPVGPEGLARMTELYRGGVAYLDHDLGDLFAGLDRRGLLDGSLVIVTSDHGEELREHGEFIHNQPYVENMAVPLIIHLPGGERAGTRRKGLADSVDLLPTILDVVGADSPEHLQGKSLMPLVGSGRPVRSWTLGRDKLTPSRYSLRTPDWCLVHDFESKVSQLFDLAADPGELHDVAAAHPEETARLRDQLTGLVAANRRKSRDFLPAPVGGEGVLTAEEQRRLRALGYLE